MGVYVVVPFYAWFKFYFPLFQTHYHTLILFSFVLWYGNYYHTTKQRKIKFKPKIKLNNNSIYKEHNLLINTYQRHTKVSITKLPIFLCQRWAEFVARRKTEKVYQGVVCQSAKKSASQCQRRCLRRENGGGQIYLQFLE